MTAIFAATSALNAATATPEEFDAIIQGLLGVQERNRLVSVAYRLGLSSYLQGNPSRSKLAARIVAVLREQRAMTEDRTNGKVDYIRRLEAENAKLRSQASLVQPLADALRCLIEAAPAFRSHRIGFDGSIARQRQEAHIAAEDAAKKLLADVERAKD